jgi:hypothetical protein
MNFSSLILESMGYHWVTRAPLVYNRDMEVITVPENFSTDLASVPKALWGIFPPVRSPHEGGRPARLSVRSRGPSA